MKFRHAFTFVSSVFTTNARSQGNSALYCENYVQQAWDAIIKSQARKCGYTGARWSPNTEKHRAFCLRSDPGVTLSETQARMQGFDCCEYAVSALEQVLKASQAKCGFSGARWSDSLSAHRDWWAARNRDYEACYRAVPRIKGR